MADESQLDESSVPTAGHTTDPATASAGAAAATEAEDAKEVPPPAAPPAAPKRRMIITHDKYVTLQSLIVLHLTEVERETGQGTDRDELIDWYLESKEDEMQDLEEIEYEKELITKMLRKLVKVRFLHERSSGSG